MAIIPERLHPKEDCRPDGVAKEKTLGSGSGFMPNVGMKRLLRPIRKEANSVARDRLLAYRYRKEG